MRKMDKNCILVTGGAGYIGSHACLELLKAGHEVSGFDNFCNSSPESIERVKALAGKPMRLEKLDLRDPDGLDALLGEPPGLLRSIHRTGVL